MAKEVPVPNAAITLNVRPQQIYNLIRKGTLEAIKPAGSRSKCVDLELTRQKLEEEKNRPKNQGGRHLNWDALTAFLKKAKTEEVRLSVSKLREMVQAPEAKLEMLHYWDPYRITINQGPGLKAIRAAGFDISSIRFAHSDFIDMIGASIITVRRNES